MCDSPPSLGVRLTLKHLALNPELIEVDFVGGEQFSAEYLQKSPQGEVPLLDDNGFYLSESAAIHQYLADKYSKDDSFYPTDPQKRAIVNHRIAFNLSTLYNAIFRYQILPTFYAYERSEASVKNLSHALKVFNDMLERQNTKFAASENLTIADNILVGSIQTLEAIRYDLSPYPRVEEWYNNFKEQHSELWGEIQRGMEYMREFTDSPPDLGKLQHPLHPTNKEALIQQ